MTKLPRWLLPVGLIASGVSVVVYLAARAKLAGWSPVSVQGGYLLGPLGFRYRITDEDLLWLGRCVVGEAGTSPSVRHASAVIWALAQNFALVNRITPLPTLTAITRAYSHLLREPTAEWCSDHPTLCDDLRASIRARLQVLPWSGLPAVVQQCLVSFRAGTLANPVPGYTDWASVPYTGGFMNIDGNIFGVSPSRILRRDA